MPTKSDESSRDEQRRFPRRARNMHESTESCDDDVCSCEPEPRWQQVAEENEAADRRDEDGGSS